MSPSPQLAPPGSSTYSSNTLHVGDGTWDSQRNTFLLPNLMGLNFETMQYNGMGNRFRNMAGYHSLIRAHGVIAAITFLGLVPISILIARFYSRSSYWSLRLHIWMQILTLFLTTVVFVTGWFAVGPSRSLTNPHHGIGLAIYVLVISQILWGWFVHNRLKGKRRLYQPFTLMIHSWLGRAIALLGLAQIPLGLTLYGSPLSLFILYALAVFTLLVIYFVLSYLRERRLGLDYDRRSYSAGPEVIDDRNGSLAAAGAAGAGAAILGSRIRRRSRSRSSIDDRSERAPYTDEKSEDQRPAGWKRKLFQFAGIAGAAGLAKHALDKRRDREGDAESGRYRPAHTATESYDDDYTESRLEEGRTPPPAAHRHRYEQSPSAPQTQYTESEFTSRNIGGHGPRNAMFGAGILGAVKGLFKSRAAREEERRLEELRLADLESERMMRERRYTGDGRPSRRNDQRYPSFSEVTGPTDAETVQSAPSDGPPVPPHHHELGSDTVTSLDQRADPGAAAGGAAAGASNQHRFSGTQGESVESPPVSIKVKLHNNGRRVTLRQLTREEAEATREARRRDRSRFGRRRREASLSGGEGDDHWRRVEELERQQEQEMRNGNASVVSAGPSAPPPAPPVPQPEPMPPAGSGLSPIPPPPIPAAGAIHSPLTMSTDLSGSFASRSGRRRAERRTQARQGGSRVEFT
ncbi:hypothetical protein D8B26_008163 [Coccidioides posadasii str. Silveira]|uniref:Uncharacterized protein n=3 Tax=Coccidioides posadasii TaxID=199306 RepID=E9DDR1_COCPS|nr:hypothetical protein CPC735_070440 [Coccidioides posadasii C735 delta SOWgp]EER29362.1 hypothetical protein CPC735_070440 [Coccidioides posadasii C735 delta SOWgp]EFW15265.1 conserved hypothetical protein [Coccidioides posadasii str. Silveira]QVM13555.1 hypothetical protein D8B26_008163 [Coccidioides posadasii str. Silveira]|eukprot:XP_003071507.1 hypothetical protein CPC735_070440 [Coccidioides posadasii C735 delta SOWgp]